MHDMAVRLGGRGAAGVSGARVCGGEVGVWLEPPRGGALQVFCLTSGFPFFPLLPFQSLALSLFVFWQQNRNLEGIYS